MAKAYIALGINHAEDEEAPYRWEHDGGFEPEELPELVWAEEREGQMDQPEQEEREHAGTGDAYAGRDGVRDVHVIVPKHRAEHIGDQRRSRVQLNTVPDNGQRSSSENEVVRSWISQLVPWNAIVGRRWCREGTHLGLLTPHAKNAPANHWVANVVNTRATGVEEHRYRANELRQEDRQDALPPVQPDTDHC